MKKFIMTVAIILLTVTTSFAMGWRDRNVDPPVGEQSFDNPIPVLLIHGWFGSSTSWVRMINDMQAKGYPGDLIFTIDLPSNVNNLCQDFNAEIDKKVQDIMGQTGSTQVDLVGWSRGGNNVYKYSLDHPGIVRNCVLLDGVTRGCFSIGDDPTPGDDTLYYNIIGTVAREIPGATNVKISGSHYGLGTNPAAWALIYDGLNGNGSN